MNPFDPWTGEVQDYSKLFTDFGVSPFEELLPRIPRPHRLMRRRVIFAHRSYESVLNAMLAGERFAAMSGFMPSGRIHLGHKMVMEEIIWHQQQGGDAFLAIADMEAHAVRGIPWDQCRRLGIEEYILSAIALGLEPGATVYFQSACQPVRDLAFELGIKANFSELSAIYGFGGETSISHMTAAVIQSADILQPQLKEHGGPRPVVIPVGADQDPHIRLTRGLAHRMNMFLIESRSENQDKEYISIRRKTAPPGLLEKIADRLEGDIQKFEAHIDVRNNPDIRAIQETVRGVELEAGGYAFLPPAATYHRFMTGLQGGKMSSSQPESYIALTEPPEDAARKIMRGKTGGRVSLEEQRKLGGQPEVCSIYELFLYHLIEDDQELQEIYQECRQGNRMCGPCKKHAAELMTVFLREHQQKREEAREWLGEFGIKERT